MEWDGEEERWCGKCNRDLVVLISAIGNRPCGFHMEDAYVHEHAVNNFTLHCIYLDSIISIISTASISYQMKLYHKLHHPVLRYRLYQQASSRRMKLKVRHCLLGTGCGCIPKQLKTSFHRMFLFLVNINTPHRLNQILRIGRFSFIYKSPEKLPFLWETYVIIVKRLDTLHRCDYFEKA